MRTALSRTSVVVLSIALSALFLWLAARGVELSLFWESLQECKYVLLVPAFATLVVGVVIRSLRWQLLFAPATRPPFGAVTRALLVGQLFNVVLPMRAGEAARIVVEGDVGEAGAFVYPPVPAVYAKPASLEEMVDHTLGRVLDLFGLESGSVRRWDPR